MNHPIFISYSTTDDEFVKKLRQTLELHGESFWIDSRQLSPGDDLVERIEVAITQARHFFVVVSFDSLGSEWVQRELKFAQQQAALRDDGFKVIPVVLHPVTAGHLKPLFPSEPLFIPIDDTPTGLDNAIAPLLSALGHQKPADGQAAEKVMAELIYYPADNSRTITGLY